jgi:hypothetical protein
MRQNKVVRRIFPNVRADAVARLDEFIRAGYAGDRSAALDQILLHPEAFARWSQQQAGSIKEPAEVS